MTAHTTDRGHQIELVNGAWRFEDTKEPTVGNRRPCGYCDRPETVEGHDACLGTLPGVLNACCGHGVDRDAYVQMKDGRHASGWKNIAIMLLNGEASKVGA